jgi:polysaccharide export outer membrane protein
MSENKSIYLAARFKQEPASLLIASVCLFLVGCGGVGPISSSTAQQSAMESAQRQQSMTSAAETFNRTLSASAVRDVPTSADYPIGPQDLLEVSLFNIDATDGIPNKVQVRVTNNGFITLPVVGQLRAGGMTRTELEQHLRQAYGRFMHDPDVGVALAENQSKSVSVLGAVQKPGVLPVTGHETLRRLLSMAGGLTKEAGMFVHLSRQTTEEEKTYVISLDDLAKDNSGKFNLPVRTGDFINVPLAGTFFVDGQVERPNAYPLTSPYTLSQALSVAGGVGTYGKRSEISVLRRGPNQEMQVLNRDLDKIRAGEEEDIKIAENDVIVVPTSTGRVVLEMLLGAVGYTSRTGSSSVTFGRAGGARGVPLP